jgi:hypothetical protein
MVQWGLSGQAIVVENGMVKPRFSCSPTGPIRTTEFAGADLKNIHNEQNHQEQGGNSTNGDMQTTRLLVVQRTSCLMRTEITESSVKYSTEVKSTSRRG